MQRIARWSFVPLMVVASSLVVAGGKDPGKWRFDPTESSESCLPERPLPLCGPFFAERARITASFDGADPEGASIDSSILRAGMALATCWFRYNGYLDCASSANDACLLVIPGALGLQRQSFSVLLVYPAIARPLLECLDLDNRAKSESRWGALPKLGAHVEVAFTYDDSVVTWVGAEERLEALAPCSGMDLLCSKGWFPELCVGR